MKSVRTLAAAGSLAAIGGGLWGRRWEQDGSGKHPALQWGCSVCGQDSGRDGRWIGGMNVHHACLVCHICQGRLETDLLKQGNNFYCTRDFFKLGHSRCIACGADPASLWNQAARWVSTPFLIDPSLQVLCSRHTQYKQCSICCCFFKRYAGSDNCNECVQQRIQDPHQFNLLWNKVLSIMQSMGLGSSIYLFPALASLESIPGTNYHVDGMTQGFIRFPSPVVNEACIWVQISMSPGRTVATIAHELTHVYLMGLTLDLALEEAICDTVAYVVLSLFLNETVLRDEQYSVHMNQYDITTQLLHLERSQIEPLRSVLYRSSSMQAAINRICREKPLVLKS